MVHNQVLIYIGGANYSKYLEFAPKYQNLLDSELDEFEFSLVGIKKERFEMGTPLEVVVNVFDDLRKTKETETYYYVIGGYPEREKLTTQKKLYKVNMVGVEPTKIAEGIICDTLTFTNPLHRDYASGTEAVMSNEQWKTGNNWDNFN